MDRVKKLFKNKAFVAFCLSFLLGSLIVLPNVIMNKGIYSLVADLNYQQIPFNEMINASIKDGSFLWTWYNEFGSNMIGTFGFYNIFSPFNILGYLFPASWFPYLIGPIYILKYAVCGLTSYLFLKRYVKNKNYAILGSLLYSFCGFQLTNILFYHFHDVVAFFPLLLYSLDNLMYDNKKGRLALCVALSAITNWFFFIGQCVFLVIYFFVKVILKEYKLTLKKFICIVIEGIIGVGMAAFVLLPCALFTMGNTRLSTAWTVGTSIKHPVFRYLEILRAFIFPSEVMSIRGVMSAHNYSSVEIYLPVVGAVLAISYFFKNKKKWDSILMFVLCVFMIIPILNSSFILFQFMYYARWFYMAALILVLMSVKCLDESINIKSGVILSVVGGILFLIGLVVYSFVKKAVYNKTYFILFLVFMVVNLIVLCLIKNRKNNVKLLIISIFLYITFWGNMNVYYYKGESFKTTYEYERYLDSYKYVKLDKNSRSNSSSACEYNYGIANRFNNIKVFNSNVNGSSFQFHESLGIERSIYTDVNVSDKKFNDFLGVSYVLSCNHEDLSGYGYLLVDSYGDYSVYYNPDVFLFGFNLNKYVSLDEFFSKDFETRKSMLNEVIVLNDEQINEYKDLFNEEVSYSLNEFEFIKNGLRSKIISSGDTLAIYQIPYDRGFSATVNGKDVKIENVDNGLMAIRINEGENNIVFKYMTPGLIPGLVICFVSVLGYVCYVVVCKKKNL